MPKGLKVLGPKGPLNLAQNWHQEPNPNCPKWPSTRPSTAPKTIAHTYAPGLHWEAQWQRTGGAYTPGGITTTATAINPGSSQETQGRRRNGVCAQTGSAAVATPQAHQ